jgi:hypothetical protein
VANGYSAGTPENKESPIMANKGKTQLLMTWVASPDQVPEVDRLVESHGSFMAKTHDRDGSNALVSYDLSKGPELENPLDPGSKSTGSTRYVLSEIYSSPAGIADHWRLTQESGSDFGAMVEMLASCELQTLHCGSIAESLW